VSERAGLSLGYILRTIRAIINGAPVPEDFAHRQENTRRDVRRRVVRSIFIEAPLLIVAMTLLVVYVLPAIKQLFS